MTTYTNGVTITNDTSENAEVLRDLILEYGLSGEDVMDLFLNWHGTSLVTENMMDDLLRVEFDWEEEEEEEEEEDEEDEEEEEY